MRRSVGGLQREVAVTVQVRNESVERVRPAEAVAAKVPTRRLTPAESRAQITSLPPDEQIVVFERIAKRLAEQRVRRVAEKVAARVQRREAGTRLIAGERPKAPTGMLAVFKRSSFEKSYAQWHGRYEAARGLTNQAYGLQQVVAQAGREAPVNDWVRGRMRKVDPGLVDRVDGYKREAFDRVWKEQQRVREQARVKDRDRGQDLDRGLER